MCRVGYSALGTGSSSVYVTYRVSSHIPARGDPTNLLLASDSLANSRCAAEVFEFTGCQLKTCQRQVDASLRKTTEYQVSVFTPPKFTLVSPPTPGFSSVHNVKTVLARERRYRLRDYRLAH